MKFSSPFLLPCPDITVVSIIIFLISDGIALYITMEIGMFLLMLAVVVLVFHQHLESAKPVN